MVSPLRQLPAILVFYRTPVNLPDSPSLVDGIFSCAPEYLINAIGPPSYFRYLVSLNHQRLTSPPIDCPKLPDINSRS